MPDARAHLHGKDETSVAQSAIKDAINHSRMIGIGTLFKIGNFKNSKKL
ncbi:Lin0512 family protein [Thermoproteota archaeon]